MRRTINGRIPQILQPPLRIVFAGTPDFALPSLEALAASRQRLVAVYTQPDRPAGRGRKLRASPVKQRALELGIPVEQPPTLRATDIQQRLAAYRPELIVVVAYGLLLPDPVLELPGLGCVNVHASLLPRWRGAAPIQRALLAGDETTGVSIMQVDAGLDTGPVLLQRELALSASDTAESVHDGLAALGAEALLEAVEALGRGEAESRPQDDSVATHAPKISKDEARLDWSRPAAELDRAVRAFNPWPVAEALLDSQRLRIWEAEAVPEATGEPGRVVAAGRDGVDVGTGQGLLRLKRLQLPGGRVLEAHEFLNAQPMQGKLLG